MFSKSNYFTNSFKFTKSSKFSFSEEFTRSEIFSGSNSFTPTNTKSFTNSDIFSDSKQFTKSETFLPTPTQSLHSHFISVLSSASLSYTQIPSVDLTHTVYLGKTYLFTYLNGSLTSYETQTLFQTRLYYVVYISSPTYVPVSIKYELEHKGKKISPEMLIGIVCGSVAAFFSILVIIIFIVRKNQYYEISSVPEETSSLNEEEQNESVGEISNINFQGIQENNIDNWL